MTEKPAEKDLKPIEDMVAKEKEADANRRTAEAGVRQWTRIRDQIREGLAAYMGDATVGVIDGNVVLQRVDTSQFAVARFRTSHPDMWEEVKVPKLVYEVDVNKLKEIDEDLYNSFCTTRWYNEVGD